MWVNSTLFVNSGGGIIFYQGPNNWFPKVLIHLNHDIVITMYMYSTILFVLLVYLLYQSLLFTTEPLVVLERPSNTSTIYHRFTDESINFTCNAAGTGTTLQWYHNTEKLSVTSNTLVLDTLVVDNAGVYQCFWEESEDGSFALDTWALAIQVPGTH